MPKIGVLLAIWVIMFVESSPNVRYELYSFYICFIPNRVDGIECLLPIRFSIN